MDAELQRNFLLRTHDPERLKQMFRDRKNDGIFRELGVAVIGPVRAAMLDSQQMGHIVVWAGYEYLIGGQER